MDFMHVSTATPHPPPLHPSSFSPCWGLPLLRVDFVGISDLCAFAWKICGNICQLQLPHTPPPHHALACCPCMASCRFQRRPFCCVCKPFFVPGVARSTRRRLQFACAPFSLLPGPEQRLLPPPISFCCSAPSCYSFYSSSPSSSSYSSSLSSPSSNSCLCLAPFSLILWEFSAATPPAAPLPLPPLHPSPSISSSLHTHLYPSPIAPPSPPFSVYFICQKMFTARVLRAAKNALAAIEKLLPAC